METRVQPASCDFLEELVVEDLSLAIRPPYCSESLSIQILSDAVVCGKNVRVEDGERVDVDASVQGLDVDGAPFDPMLLEKGPRPLHSHVGRANEDWMEDKTRD